MGIKDFFKVKIQNADSAYNNETIANISENINLKKLAGKKLAVDASLMIYSSVLAMESIKSLTDLDGKTTVHINTIFNKAIQLAEAGINQIWIFDSPEPNDLKKTALIARRERREKAETEDISVLEKEKRQYKLNSEHVNDIKELFDYMGIMHIQAPKQIEAEQYGAFLTKGSPEERFCQYMITSDPDVLMFGGNMLRMTSDKSSSGKTKKTVYQIYELQEVIGNLSLTYDQLVVMGVALGSDFASKMEGIGPAKAIKIAKDPKVLLSPMQKKAIEYFKSDISDKMGEAVISQQPYNREKLIEYLLDKKFNLERLNKRLAAYEKHL